MSGMDTLIDDILSTIEEAKKFNYADFVLRADLRKVLEEYYREVERYAYEEAKDDLESSNENYGF